MVRSSDRGQIIIETVLVLAAFLLFVVVLQDLLREGREHVQRFRVTRALEKP